MVKQLLRDGKPTEPMAQATHFGWVLSGHARRKHNSAAISTHHPLPIIPTTPVLAHIVQNYKHSKEEASSLPATAQNLSARSSSNSPINITKVDHHLQNHFHPSVDLAPAEELPAAPLPPISPTLPTEERTEVPISIQNSLPSNTTSFGAGTYSKTAYRDSSPTAAILSANLQLTDSFSTALPRLQLSENSLLTKLLTNVVINISPINWPRQNAHFIIPMSFTLQVTLPNSWHPLAVTYNSTNSANLGLLPVTLPSHSLQWEELPWLNHDPGPALKNAHPHLPPMETEILHDRQPSTKTARLQSLHLILDKNIIQQMNDRISTLPMTQQQTVIPDAKDTFNSNYFQCSHVSFCHCGSALLLPSTESKLPAPGARHQRLQDITLTASLCQTSNCIKLLLLPKEKNKKRLKSQLHCLFPRENMSGHVCPNSLGFLQNSSLPVTLS